MAELSDILNDIRRQALFWKSVDVSGNNECWEWQAAKLAKGHGTFKFCGGTALAHRLSWVIANRKSVPDQLLICHECDNPGCVNPRHLFVGTQQANMDDARQKGRLTGPHLKTHCLRGHPFSEENTIVRGRSRKCRACCALLARRQYAAGGGERRKRKREMVQADVR